MSRFAERIARRLVVGEAIILLIAARLLIAAVRFKYWRATLGADGTRAAGQPLPTDVTTARMVAAAVDRAAQRLGAKFKCLPRAMAVQWMLARRGVAASLVFGVACGRAGQSHDLHSWVDVGGVTVIGADTSRDYAPSLTLTLPRR